MEKEHKILRRNIKSKLYELIVNQGIEEIETYDRPEDFTFDFEATQIKDSFILPISVN